MLYTKYTTKNETMQAILFAYCEGRSFLWNIWFGWRSSNNKGESTFIIPTKKIETLEIYAKDLDKHNN